MLVLSRQREESIMIAKRVEVKIVDVRGDKIRLGITAPQDLPVHRWEIFRAIKIEQLKDEETFDPNMYPILANEAMIGDDLFINGTFLPGSGMLVLSRSKDEVIMIGDRVSITSNKLKNTNLPCREKRPFAIMGT